MSRATGSGPAALPDLPCHADPDRWFDRDDRSRALSGCLTCPVRSWCAREALRSKACWGMWAGVWIDGNHTAAIAHLQDVAEAPPAPLPLRALYSPPNHAAPQHHYAPAPAPALIAARSSGHCEVMVDGCRYTGDVMLSRVTGCAEPELPSAAHGFLACDPCRSRLQQPGRIATHELGYRLHSPTAVYTTAFFWRQTRWALLDPDGRLLDAHTAATDGRRTDDLAY